MAVPGAGANAATNQAITSCGVDSSLLSGRVRPTCAASTGTIYNPTQVAVDPSFFLSKHWMKCAKRFARTVPLAV
jgi:hypothetical protein